jgi:hypothetical protein
MPLATTTVKRHRWLLEPGEPLLLSRSPTEAMARLGEQMATWGLGPEDLFVSPLCAVALPLAPVSGWPPRCFASKLRPSSLRSPLLWLPPHLSRPAEGEGLFAWGARVALELSAAGIYDQTSGTWLDIGNFVEGDLSAERSERWLAGEADADLDAVDLTPLTWDEVDPLWALDKVEADYGWLSVVSWSLWSESLADEVADLLRGPAEGVTAHLGMLSAVAGKWLAEIPPEVAGEEAAWWAEHSTRANALELLEHAKATRSRLEPWLQQALAERPAPGTQAG